jgi:hypothetical protein
MSKENTAENKAATKNHVNKMDNDSNPKKNKHRNALHFFKEKPMP